MDWTDRAPRRFWCENADCEPVGRGCLHPRGFFVQTVSTQWLISCCSDGCCPPHAVPSPDGRCRWRAASEPADVCRGMACNSNSFADRSAFEMLLAFKAAAAANF